MIASRQRSRLFQSEVQADSTASPLASTAGDCCDKSADTCDNQSSSTFIVDLNQIDVTDEEVSDRNLVEIVNLLTSDDQANKLAWKCLGYRYNPTTKEYDNNKVFPKWKLKYPSPPDLIGVTRTYSPDVDRIVRNASMDLMRSIPRDYKGGVRSLVDAGFKGYALKDLTPNKTRRAQLVNWLLYYREKLRGKSFEELTNEKLKEKEKSEDIANLPSERMFQKLRLDDLQQ